MEHCLRGVDDGGGGMEGKPQVVPTGNIRTFRSRDMVDSAEIEQFPPNSRGRIALSRSVLADYPS